MESHGISPKRNDRCDGTGPQRENFPGGTKVDTGPPILIGPPKPYRNVMPLKPMP